MIINITAYIYLAPIEHRGDPWHWRPSYSSPRVPPKSMVLNVPKGPPRAETLRALGRKVTSVLTRDEQPAIDLQPFHGG